MSGNTITGVPGFRNNTNLEIIDLRETSIKSVPRHVFSSIITLRTVYGEMYQLCCKGSLPKDFPASDCHAPEDAISSCQRLVRSETLPLSLWLLASLALVANIIANIAFLPPLPKTVPRFCLRFHGDAGPAERV